MMYNVQENVKHFLMFGGLTQIFTHLLYSCNLLLLAHYQRCYW